MKTPVLLIMFTRWNTLEKVFEQVRKAQPEKLYLYQDGPRADCKEADMEGILKCRDIVSQIDWDCEVIKKYMEKNVGCDPGSYYAYKWFYSEEDKGIILEDDAVPSQSFFLFCEELLEKYENDKRIYRICGANIEGISDISSSYSFSRKGSTGSWATWKRVADMWDESYSFLDDENELDLLKSKFENDDYYQEWLKGAIFHKNTGVPYYETIFDENKIINDMLDIIPGKNLVTNIGLTYDAVHNKVNPRTMPSALRKYFGAPRYELDFPLTHPKEVTENMHYTNSINRMMGWGHPGLRFVRRWESRVKRIAFGTKEERKQLLKNVVKVKK